MNIDQTFVFYEEPQGA